MKEEWGSGSRKDFTGGGVGLLNIRWKKENKKQCSKAESTKKTKRKRNGERITKSKKKGQEEFMSKWQRNIAIGERKKKEKKERMKKLKKNRRLNKNLNRKQKKKKKMKENVSVDNVKKNDGKQIAKGK